MALMHTTDQEIFFASNDTTALLSPDDQADTFNSSIPFPWRDPANGDGLALPVSSAIARVEDAPVPSDPSKFLVNKPDGAQQWLPVRTIRISANLRRNHQEGRHHY
jgi:hypothetical protein